MVRFCFLGGGGVLQRSPGAIVHHTHRRCMYKAATPVLFAVQRYTWLRTIWLMHCLPSLNRGPIVLDWCFQATTTLNPNCLLY